MTNTLDAVEQTAGLALTQQQQAELHELYRHLHAHPELSMQEHRTAEFIEQRLDGLDIENFRCIATVELELSPRATGIVGSNASGKTSTARAIAGADTRMSRPTAIRRGSNSST